ncbi:protein of unknown function [Cupriavidus taiwanensis]|nr:protein of unknown function [Cupriavidus taiwanensis]
MDGRSSSAHDPTTNCGCRLQVAENNIITAEAGPNILRTLTQSPASSTLWRPDAHNGATMETPWRQGGSLFAHNAQRSKIERATLGVALGKTLESGYALVGANATPVAVSRQSEGGHWR